MATQKISQMDPAGALDGTEMIEVVQNGMNVRTTTGYIAALAGGDGGGTGDFEVITEAAEFTATTTHSGLKRYIRAGGDVTFDAAEGYTVGQVFNVRATAALELVGNGVALEATAGGTLSLDARMAVTVVMTSPTTADVIGLTVAA